MNDPVVQKIYVLSISLTCRYIPGPSRLIPWIGAEQARVMPLLYNNEGDAGPVIRLQGYTSFPISQKNIYLNIFLLIFKKLIFQNLF